MTGYSNGNSFGTNSNSIGDGERRNTETWLWRLQGQVQPGAAS